MRDFLIYIQSYDSKCEANLNYDIHSWIIYSVGILDDCYLIDYAPLSQSELNRFYEIDTYNLQKRCNGTTWFISVYVFIFVSLI